LLLKYPFTRQF